MIKNNILNKKLIGVMNCLALLLVVQSANVACVWMFHQPAFPSEANRYKKNS